MTEQAVAPIEFQNGAHADIVVLSKKERNNAHGKENGNVEVVVEDGDRYLSSINENECHGNETWACELRSQG